MGTQARECPSSPTTIGGYNSLYADLNHDGRIERVGLVDTKLPGSGGFDYRGPDDYHYGYKIVVLNDAGKVMWRSDFEADEYASQIKYCLLRDIDGDGNIELVLSCEEYSDLAPIVSFVPYRIYTWKNGAFRAYQRTTRGGDAFAAIRQGKDGIFRVNGAKSEDGTNNGLYCLRQISGQLWGDVVVKTVAAKEYDNKIEKLPDDVKVVSGDDNLYFCQTVRLEPCEGGLRIVEYKKY